MRIKQVMFFGMIFLVLNNLSFSREKYHLQKKTLPLDRVPNVAMKTSHNSRYVHNQVIVKLNSSVIPSQVRGKFGAPALDEFVRRYSVQSVARIFPHHKSPSAQSNVDLTKFFILKFNSPMDAFKVAEEISNLPEVQYAEPVFIHSIDDMATCTPLDSLRSQQWALNKIQADTAWCISDGDTSVIIGIVDTGVQWDHPDLQ
ncbi:MAG TPA: hypothetical protein VFF29_00155, partial [Bacteroidota bacterium]|nr:hypothetical protein [Bacteroidota bacterium]